MPKIQSLADMHIGARFGQKEKEEPCTTRKLGNRVLQDKCVEK